MASSKRVSRILHVGAWSGNFGDSIIQDSIRINLQRLSNHPLEFTYWNCQRTRFTEESVREINETFDLVIVGGGGLVFYRPQDESVSGWQWNIETELIRKIRVPYVLYGIGYNQFEYDSTNFLPTTNRNLQEAVNRAALATVRNRGTRRDLMKRGCSGFKLKVIPDSGMFAEAKKFELPGLDSDRVKIGFNWTTDRESQTFPAPFPETKDQFIDRCITCLNDQIQKRGAQIVYLGHMGGGFDRAIINRLKGGLIEPPLILDEVAPDLYPPSGDKAGLLIDLYRQMDVVLGMRGHANIVAFGQDVPHIGLGSHRKIRYFLEDTKRSRYFFDGRVGHGPTDTKQMTILLDELIDNQENHRKKIARELSRQKAIFDRFNRKVLNLL